MAEENRKSKRSVDQGDTRAEDSRESPISKSDQARASSAHSRINVPINLGNWKKATDAQQQTLLWFHQHLLDEEKSWSDCDSILPKPGRKGGFYDHNSIYKALKGISEGGYTNICDAIEKYRKLIANRHRIKNAAFSQNDISDMIWSGLDYAASANAIVEIVGESGQGKTFCTKAWKDLPRNNHGKTVMVECPVMGGVKALLREIVNTGGSNKNHSILQMQDSIRRAFNPYRHLIIDEPARLLPNDRNTPPRNLDFFRWLHDQTGCAITFLVTARFDSALMDNDWMFEQLIGRIDHHIQLPEKMGEESWMPLLTQYVPAPTTKTKQLCQQIVDAKRMGRMRKLSKILKFASAIATQRKEELGEKHVTMSARKLLRTPATPAKK